MASILINKWSKPKCLKYRWKSITESLCQQGINNILERVWFENVIII